jgi:hypothetical protein
VLAAAVAAAALVTGCGAGTTGDKPGAIPPPRSPSPVNAVPSETATPHSAATRRRRAAAGALLSGADARSLIALERRLGAELGVAVATLGHGRSASLGSLRSGEAWSTIKVPMAAAVIRDAGGPSNLRAGDAQAIRSALTASDNAAAAALWARLAETHGGADGAAAAVEAVLADAGDNRTSVSMQGRGSFSPYGQTQWSLSAQGRFMAGLASGCAFDQGITGSVLELMGEVVAAQRWGLGSIGLPVRFKGGWGPGVDGRYLVRQVGVIELDGGSRAVSVALAARAVDGSFESGTRALSRLAGWVSDHLNVRSLPRTSC